MTPTFTVAAKTLAEALTLLAVTAETKTTIPALAYVLLDGSGTTLSLSATDMDCAVTTKIDAAITGTIAACVPLRDLLELARLLKGDITVEIVGAQAWAKSATTKHRFPTLPANEFRAITPATEVVATLDGSLLASMMAAAMVGMETNPQGDDKWKALEVSAANGELSITGGNNARIVNATTPCDATFYTLLPDRSASVLRMFAEANETVELSLLPNLLTATSSTGEASLKLSALKWPNWHMLIAPSYPVEVPIDPTVLLPALKRSLLACDSNPRIPPRLDFALTSTAMVIDAQGKDREGREEVTIDCAALNGDTLAFGVNGGQLLDFFKVCKGAATWRIPSNSPAQMLVPVEPLPFGFRYIQATMKARAAE